jgi:ATP-dependent Clp protease adaptor protein ClpS
MPKEKTGGGVETVTRDDTRVRKPKLYKVLLLNDDYTTMDFVVSVLEGIFRKSPAEALQIMLHVHQRGQGLCGLYAREIAEAKVHQVHERARAEGHPLRCVMDEE